ncbi:uncharacterized protein TRIVIDRAFT_172676 [Trichoderma virens Gv29-8]|uniref:Uncharacterized protein n=1 Tax=Hypocrea virens (strain Gv29-8 / FGSC 10586) TaxID=413071 RepID=G9N413_HYPVG|nr:uncharacterized protein TRIVIDRAFT_172676 [Trichoderma virens Gv29-8]EHK18340.1 hypothetical protein TRIVIDRAFT_172676 [Trichoderma virens Gv29-8]
MPQNHRPDFYVFRSSRAQRGNRKYRHCYMLPHINQNDLTMQDSLPLLINSRAFYTPSHFVDIDLQSMKLGLQTGILKSVSLPGYSMVLLDAETIDDYGKLVDISKYSEEEILDLDKTHITPYYGILLLEAQDRLMAFLVSCCKQILHDIPEENLVSEKFPISIGSPKFLNNSGVYGPAVMAAQAPYRVPGKPNFKQIGLLLGAKMEQIKDHLLNLREDPAYFANTIKMMKDYSAKVWDVHTNTHFLLSGKSKTNLFSFLQYMIAKPYADFEFFSDLYEKNQQLERLHTEYEADIIPFKGVPDEILKALCKYQMSLWESIDFRRLILIRVIRSSSVWFRHFNDSADSLNSFRRDVGNYKASSVRRHLIWLLQCVTEWDPKLPRLIKPYHLILPLLMDGIETLRENEPEAWELTSSLIGEIIDELAILTKCMEKVNLYLLQTRRYERPTAGGKSIYTNLVNDELDYLHPLLALEHEAYFSVTEFEEIATKTLVYPWDKRRTKENVRAMQKAERDLDTFWDAADSFIFNKIKLFHEFPVGKHITSIKKTLQRTPDWIEEEGSIIPRPVRQRKASQGDDEDYKPPFAPCDDQSDSPGKFRQDSRHCLQIKVKTKGQAHKAVAQVDVRAIEEVTSESIPLIPVDKRALKVFRVLFYNPDVTSSPGEVPWNDFIHAMVCIGFSAQKLQGSIWQFSRLNHGGHQTILFHEPHPHKKVPFCAARSIGWRLNRHFQWSLESFVLKKKQTEVLE